MTSKPEEIGDCYLANGSYILNNYILKKANPDGVFLCHGKVIGAKGSKVEGLVFGHAWVEIRGVLLDFSNGKTLAAPLDKLYENGRIIKDSVKRYTPMQVADMVLKHEHYGAWDDEN